MYINVAELLKESIGSSRCYQINELIGKEGINSIKGEVTLIHTNRGILAKGTMAASVTDICSRCLTSVDYPVSFCLEDEFFPSVNISNGAPLPEIDSPTIDRNHILDLSEAMRQYTLLAMPVKPLCRSDCAGICPSCGYNLNQGSCQCSSRVYDRR